MAVVVDKRKRVRSNSKKVRVAEKLSPGAELLLSILKHLDNGLAIKDIALMIGVEEKYLKLWLSVLVHFDCIMRNSRSTRLELTTRGRNLLRSFDFDKFKE